MRQQNQEDYLRAIYQIHERGSTIIRSVDVAECLGFSKAAVSRMSKRLVQLGLIKMKPYSGLAFTAKGLTEARRLTFKHRVIEVFLRDMLNVKKSRVHEEAHRLEHAFSDQAIKKLAYFLGNPVRCPYGKRIPKFS